MMRGWTTVFKFSFRNTAGGRGYRLTTLLVALILLLGIASAMLLTEILGSDDAGEENAISRAVTIGEADMSAAAMAGGMYTDVIYENAPDMEAAVSACADDKHAVILIVEDAQIIAVTPENSSVGTDQAQSFAGYLAGIYPYVLAGENAFADDIPVSMGTSATEAQPGKNEGIAEVIGMIVPYVVVMLMYFMVLIYGQGIANDAIMEKTSKLMDLFLVSIKPGAMMLGKVLAGAAAGLLQTLMWIFSAVGGCALGVELVKGVNPDTDMAAVALVESLGGIGGIFPAEVLITAALVIASGFLVYCGLAGVGGALASKPEDLGSTNYLFTMALVISFFACLFTGESAGMISEAEWMGYVPFTSVLVMPGRLLTGAATAAQGLIAAVISAAFAVIVCMFAGKAYAMMAFYRGKPVNPVKLIKSFSLKR